MTRHAPTPDPSQPLLSGFVTASVRDDLRRTNPVNMRLAALKYLAAERSNRDEAAGAAIQSLFSRSERLVSQALTTIKMLGACPENVEHALRDLYGMLDDHSIPCLSNPTHYVQQERYYRAKIAATLTAIGAASNDSAGIYADILRRGLEEKAELAARVPEPGAAQPGRAHMPEYAEVLTPCLRSLLKLPGGQSRLAPLMPQLERDAELHAVLAAGGRAG